MKTLNEENKIMKEAETKKTIRVKFRKPPERAAKVNVAYNLAKLVVIRRANYE